MFLEQPESDAAFGPVGCQTGWFRLVEDVHTLLNFTDDHCFGFFEECVEFVGPLERGSWLEELAEWQHALSHCKSIRDLVDQAKPRADISDVSWYREVADGIQVFCAWPHIAGGDLKSREFDSVSSEHELVWVKYDPIVSTEVEPVDRLEETFVEVICPEKGVRCIWFCLGRGTQSH